MTWHSRDEHRVRQNAYYYYDYQKGDARINRHLAAVLDPRTSDQFAATIASISVRPARFTRMTQPIFHARPFMVSNARYKTMERGVTHFASFQACESFFRSRASPDESIGSKKSAFRRRVYDQASVKKASYQDRPRDTQRYRLRGTTWRNGRWSNRSRPRRSLKKGRVDWFNRVTDRHTRFSRSAIRQLPNLKFPIQPCR